MSQKKQQILQVSDLLRISGVADTEDARRTVSTSLNLLVYLPVNSIFKTSNISFEKIAEDLIAFQTNLEKNRICDSLEKRKIIKLTV